ARHTTARCVVNVRTRGSTRWPSGYSPDPHRVTVRSVTTLRQHDVTSTPWTGWTRWTATRSSTSWSGRSTNWNGGWREPVVVDRAQCPGTRGRGVGADAGDPASRRHR